MPTDTWSSTPPTEAGLYLVKYPHAPQEAVLVDVCGNVWGLGSDCKIDVASPAYSGTLFGPLIPSAEELTEMRATIEAFRRELEYKAKDRGGF